MEVNYSSKIAKEKVLEVDPLARKAKKEVELYRAQEQEP